VIAPSWSAVNFMPTSTALLSEFSITAGVPNSSRVACGTTSAVAADGVLVPTAFVAVTRNV
jgi:hypothetical protein